MRYVDTEEVIVVAIRIDVKKETIVPERYRGIFKGLTKVPRGHYFYTYPIKNTMYSRRVDELKRWYGMHIQYGIADSKQI